jgi:excisionase family DNA binding protein
VSGARNQHHGSSAPIRPITLGPGHAEPERLAYSVDEAAAVLGVARETIYELIRTGELRSRKAGSRRIIGRHHLLEFLDGGSLADRPAG